MTHSGADKRRIQEPTKDAFGSRQKTHWPMTLPSLDPLGDGKSLLMLVDSMGNSLSIVNDARQSFGARSGEFSAKDAKLLHYLAREHHTSPFRGVVFKWHVKAPLFIARQWYKHTVASTFVDDQLGWNEKSFRYCSAENAEFYTPKQFAKQSASNRQASDGPLEGNNEALAQKLYAQALQGCTQAYKGLLLAGVSKEQARAILPPCMYTSFTWTCSLQALLHFISLRINNKSAQYESSAYAQALLELSRSVAPEAFDAFEANNYFF
jgi:thymidylate synthase (FAD)